MNQAREFAVATDRAATGAEEVAARGGVERLVLEFTLGKLEFCVDILEVQEIRSYEAVTALANAPEFLKGMLDLRGTKVPIVDLRTKFNLGGADYTQFTVVIVLNVAGRVVGMVADDVSDVLPLASAQIRPPQESGANIDTEYVTGVAVVDHRTLYLMDIDRLVLSVDMALAAAGVSADLAH